MATIDSAPQPIAQYPSPTPQRRRQRRGGRQPASGAELGSSRPNSTNINASLALRPASVVPSPNLSSAEASSAETSAAENGQRGRTTGGTPRGRGRGSMRGIGRGGEATGGRGHEIGHGNTAGHPEIDAHNQRTMIGPNRQFGGRLTLHGVPPAQSQSTLHADAPEFHPGESHHQRLSHASGGKAFQVNHHQNHTKAPRPRRQSILKSMAPDIATRTHEDIANAIYECPICTNEVARNSKVWSCRTCWTVFHLSCIKKWSTNEGSAQAQQRSENGDILPPRQWRCPGCNLPKDVLPSTYTCWCEKEIEPRSMSGLPPHSCGQTCGKARMLPKKCPHPCELLCHAGPCPPCPHLGPTQSCFCGKKSIARRCVDTNYDTGWSCGEICGDYMPCGEHTCQKSCHEGLCGACEVRIGCRCYCGKAEQSIICCEREEERKSFQMLRLDDGSISANEWTGRFKCETLCQRRFDCGIHVCEKSCHSQSLEEPHCPWSPDVVTHCPCGKTSLAELSESPRQSCDDPVPNCQKTCSKTLRCGHPCQQVCHSDECRPCLITTDIKCRCGRTQSSTACHYGSEESPQCMRSCKATLNCGRHECGERCCPGERKAAERQATKRKLRPLSASRTIDEGFEAEHICTRSCGRLLKCGNHVCPELCHKGPCGSCREAVFDEIGCHCGKTVLQPPLPCGTNPPPCRFDCERPKDCGHPRIPHNCHGDEEGCPKCPFLAQKHCLCGKTTLQNQPCWLAEVRCGELCGNKLRCGSHYCRKQCHRPGECEDAARTCHQACGKAKKACGHPCEVQCHAPSTCREDTPCQNKIFITCDCQNLKQEMKCNASKISGGNNEKTLPCDDQCARLARNQRLALALNIDPEAYKDDHVPYSNATLKMFRENVKWAQVQEREFRVFAADDTEKRLRFKPMPQHQRAFIHALSEDFGFDSESMDPEPHRHVAVFKTPRFLMAPMKTIAECVRIRTAAEASTMTIPITKRQYQANDEVYNGFLLNQPRFGLTIEELRADLAPVLDTTPRLGYNISFLPNEEIVIKAHPASSSTVLTNKAIEAALKALRNDLSAYSTLKHLAASIQLCALDSSLNVLRRELDDPASNGGWSQVAAKAAAPRFAPRQMAVGEKSVYTVLGSKLRDAKKKKEEAKKAKEAEIVIDDWEEEVRREEEEEERSKAKAQCDSEVVNSDNEQPSNPAQSEDVAQQYSAKIHETEDRVVGMAEVRSNDCVE